MTKAHNWSWMLQLILTSAFTGISAFLFVASLYSQTLPHEIQTIINGEQIQRLRVDQITVDAEIKTLQLKLESVSYEVTQVKAVAATFGIILTLLQAFVVISGRKIGTTSNH